MRNADSSFARLQSGAAQECVMRNFFNADSSFARLQSGAAQECVIFFALFSF